MYATLCVNKSLILPPPGSSAAPNHHTAYEPVRHLEYPYSEIVKLPVFIPCKLSAKDFPGLDYDHGFLLSDDIMSIIDNDDTILIDENKLTLRDCVSLVHAYMLKDNFRRDKCNRFIYKKYDKHYKQDMKATLDILHEREKICDIAMHYARLVMKKSRQYGHNDPGMLLYYDVMKISLHILNCIYALED